MKLTSTRKILRKYGSVSFIAGAAMLTCFIWLARLPGLRGPEVISFLAAFTVASVLYVVSIARLDRDNLPLALIWVFAILFRLVMLATSPTLSDDVYRYIWDGHLLNQGVNPYALPVNSPLLDAYNTPLRALVNHDWMASPYLPAAQVYFYVVNRIAPQSTLSFQVGATILDLFTAWLVMDLLRMLSITRRRVLIYLWNPLVVVEFAHGAHIDALMLCLTMAAFWLLVRARPGFKHKSLKLHLSVISLAAASLTKTVPALLAPLFFRRWGWGRVVLYILVIIAVVSIFTMNAGLGLSGPLDGSGVFGATRIYMSYWNYNSSIYHWLEVLVSNIQTPGAVPVDNAGETTFQIIRLLTGAVITLAGVISGVWAWRVDDPSKRDHRTRNLYLLRLAVLPLGVYLIFTHTLHPWYVTIIIPFIPFLLRARGEKTHTWRFVWPWIYLSCAVAISYLTYINLDDFREYPLVRWVEYLPFYLLLMWSTWPTLRRGLTWISEIGYWVLDIG